MRFLLTICAGWLLFATGCRHDLWSFWNPQAQTPYPSQYAPHFDPYPTVDGGPELVGARPLDYQKPYNEPRRVQNDRWLYPQWGPGHWFRSW